MEALTCNAVNSKHEGSDLDYLQLWHGNANVRSVFLSSDFFKFHFLSHLFFSALIYDIAGVLLFFVLALAVYRPQAYKSTRDADFAFALCCHNLPFRGFDCS